MTLADPLAPLRQPPSRQVGQLGGDIEAIRVDTMAILARPRGDTLHEQPAGTSDIEKRPVHLDGSHHGAAITLPVALVSPETGLSRGLLRARYFPS